MPPNVFDQFDNPEPTTTKAPPAPAAPALPPRNTFDRFDALSPPPQPPARMPNKPFGELKPADLSPTQQLKFRMQEILSGIGAPNYTAQRLGNAAVNIA